MSKKTVTRGAVYLQQYYPDNMINFLARLSDKHETPAFLVAATTPTEENCTTPFSTMVNILNHQTTNVCNFQLLLTPQEFIKNYYRFMKLLRIDRTIIERWAEEDGQVRSVDDSNLAMANYYNSVIQQAEVVGKFFAGLALNTIDEDSVEDLVTAVNDTMDAMGVQEDIIVDASIIKTNVLPAIAEIAALKPIPTPDDEDALDDFFKEAFGEALYEDCDCPDDCDGCDGCSCCEDADGDEAPASEGAEETDNAEG